MTEGVSIIICCYNSSLRLPTTLKHLARQNVPSHIGWEVILVDNNSKDKTGSIAKKLWQDLDSPVTLNIVKEEKPGLSHARHKGFMTARYDYCLFCDDDNWLASDYLVTAYEIMHADDKIGVLGGIGEAVCEVNPPNWFLENKSSYAVGAQADQEGDITNRGYVYGAGAIFRKSIYIKLLENGYKGFLSDRTGNIQSSGGDSELCYNYILWEKKIYYTPRLKFKHFIPATRLNENYLKNLDTGFKISIVVLRLYQYKINKSYILERKFLLLREILNSLYYEIDLIKKLRFKETFAYCLFVHREKFKNTLIYLRNI